MQSDHILLHNGIRWPLLGFGTWKIPEGDETVKAVLEALTLDYMLIDTATLYGNEYSVGRALKESQRYREDYKVTTKLWNSDQGYNETLRAFDLSQKALDLEYIDAYLIHWPMPKKNLFIETWRAFERLYHEGRVKVIGVSNFEISHLHKLIENSEIPPMINQVECHLGLQQSQLLAFCQEHEIVLQGWRPLANGYFNQHESVITIAKHHQKTPQQVMLRYLIQRGVGVIPKTVHSERLLENISIFNFVLTENEMGMLAKLDGSSARFGFDPNEYHDLEYVRS